MDRSKHLSGQVETALTFYWGRLRHLSGQVKTAWTGRDTYRDRSRQHGQVETHIRASLDSAKIPLGQVETPIGKDRIE